MSIIQVLTDAVRSEQWDHVAELAKKIVGFDVETHLIQPGLLSPPLVCASIAWFDDGEIHTKLLDKQGARAAFRGLLEDPDVVVVGQNICFDMLVMIKDAYDHDGTDLMPAVFAMYEAGRVLDVMIIQQLHAIYEGTLNLDPFTLRPLRGRYNLGTIVFHVLGREDAKKNDKWRLRYFELEGIPIEQWPEDAQLYPLDDARNTLEVCLAQLGAIDKRAKHVFEGFKRGEEFSLECKFCHTKTYASPCFRAEPHGNLHSIHDQVYTHFCMHLGAAWGFRVDQAEVKRVVEKVQDERTAMLPEFVQAGLIRPDGSRDTAAIARAVATAYDAVGLCEVCAGSGKAPSEKTGKPINCKACSATGLDIRNAPDVPLTETEKVAGGRDVLDESGDEGLMSFSAYGRSSKVVEVYGPYLAKAGDRPLTLKPNPLLETDRTSYSDVIQQFPRDKGLRECIVARPGYRLCSVDYFSGELITHAQSCIWIVGHSDLADALNNDANPHEMLGAAMLGMDYAAFLEVYNDKKHPGYRQAKDARQAAKPGNFGFPGGMGAPKMALQQRRGGPDTPCPNGPACLNPAQVAKGKAPIRGYRGLRFCILMDGADRCGERKLVEWKGRPCAPTCAACLDCAERLRDVWFGKWSEAKPYFKFVSAVVNQGQENGLEPGQVIQHVSRIVRGGCKFTNAANGYFQSLLARAAKLALRRAQRECCDRTFRVPDDACRGGVVSAYAGLDSPLLGSRVIVFQHDENIPEIPIAQEHDGATRLSELMVRALQETCPDLAPAVKAPPALMPRWYKSAEPVYHRGRLVAWTPEHDDKTCAECKAA